MKNIVFFITHKTLSKRHAELSFKSMESQTCKKQFDILYIYNSHEDEIPNNLLLEMAVQYNLKKYFKEILIFPYNLTTHKSLGGDVSSIKNFCMKNLKQNDRILLLKSDIILSINYFDDILTKLPTTTPIYFVAPFINAKKRVTDSDIIKYSNRRKYVQSDSITFFVEDMYQSSNNDFTQRDGVDVTDTNILFISCYVIRDFSCHFFTVSLFPLIRIENKSWGGVWFQQLLPYFINTNRSFTIHKYHNIQSDNCKLNRQGPIYSWLNS